MALKSQSSIQAMLQEHFAHAQLKNPAYSLRSYARQVGVSPGALSQALKGKRRFSKKMVEKICNKLLLSPDKTRQALKSFESAIEGFDLKYTELSSDIYHAISDWEHFAIISLLDLKLSKHDHALFAELLSISEQKAKEAIDRLLRLKLIKKLPSGRYSKLHARIKTSDEISSLSLKKAHMQSFEKAKDSLLNDPLNERDITSITMAIDPKRMQGAKDMIRKFQDQLAQYLEAGNKSQVYQLSVQLFPISKNTSKSKRGAK